MHRILKPSFKRLTVKKKMTSDLYEEINQVAYIAIVRAMETWDPQIATFSTHVHWKIMAELQTLQHLEFPDRRKLAIPYRIKKIELDRPCRNDDGESATMADFLTAPDGEEEVERRARLYMAQHCFERAFSNYIARKMSSYCVNQKDAGKIAKLRHRLMRNRWIYIRRVIKMENYDVIAQEYGITRERARQIIITIDEDMNGQLPYICKDTKVVVQATKPAPATVHPSWDYMLIDYYMTTGIDSRIVGRETPMPTRVDDYDFRPTVVLAEQSHEDMLNETRRLVHSPVIEAVIDPTSSGTDVTTQVEATNVVRLQSKKDLVVKVMKQAAISAIAGAMLTSVTTMAASAQSRAIPPESEGTRPAEVTIDPVVKQQQRRAQSKAATVAGRRLGGISAGYVGDIGKVSVRRASWGIQIAEYPSLAEAQKGVLTERRNWSWLSGLEAAHVPPVKRDAGHGLAFGPMSQVQADGMCHEAKRYDRTCTVVKFGVVRTPAILKNTGKTPTPQENLST